MQLDDSQIAEFDERGFLLFPGLLSSDEVAVLQKAVPEILSRQGPEVVREKRGLDGGEAGLRGTRILETVPVSIDAPHA